MCEIDELFLGGINTKFYFENNYKYLFLCNGKNNK